MKFLAYPEYRSLHFSWPSQIPSHWAVKWLKYAAPAVNEKTEDPSPDLRYIGLENVESWSGRLLEGGDYSPESTSNLFKAGDVLFGKLRPYLAKVYQASEKGVCSSEFSVLRPISVKSEFLKYYLLTQEFVGLVNSSTFGAKMPRASWEFMGHLPQVIPPEEEQQKIAQFLDYQTAKIDRLIEKQQRLIELLEQKQQAVISEAITKGLNPNIPWKDSGTEWLGQVPTHWEIKRLMYLTPKYRRIMYGIILPGPHYEGGVPIIKGGDVKEHRLRLQKLSRTDPDIEASYERSRLRPGDLVFAIRGGVGDVEVVPKELEGANLTQDAARVAPGEGTTSNWLYFALKAEPVVSQLKAGILGATVTGINIWDLKRVKLPVPPEKERDQIASYLKEQVGKYERTKSKAHVAIDRLLEHRSSLISSAVTGKIDVRDWEAPETQKSIYATG